MSPWMSKVVETSGISPTGMSVCGNVMTVRLFWQEGMKGYGYAWVRNASAGPKYVLAGLHRTSDTLKENVSTKWHLLESWGLDQQLKSYSGVPPRRWSQRSDCRSCCVKGKCHLPSSTYTSSRMPTPGVKIETGGRECPSHSASRARFSPLDFPWPLWTVGRRL